MRIGIFDPYLDSLSGGEKYMLTAAACLSDKNDVFIFWDDKDVLTKAEERFNLNLSKVKMEKNIFSSVFPLLERLILSSKYDVIFYLSDGGIPLLAAKKLILHFQFPVEWVNTKGWKNSLKKKRVFSFICNSYFTKKFIDRKFQITSKVIYPPASGEYSAFSVKKQNTIISVGRFSLISDNNSFKKQEIMLKAFKEMVDKGLKNWNFVLIISFPLKDEKKADFLIKDIKNYPIKIIKNASSKELEKVYKTARIYWHAAGFNENLEIHPEFAEHFGIATVQAMEQGAVPVVVKAGGQQEIVEDGVNGFLWSSEKELIEKTNTLVNNEKLWEKLSLEAENKAKQFSRETFCKSINREIL